MPSIDSNPDAIIAMEKADPNQPIIILNMLRFRETALEGFGVDGMSGRDAFFRYGQMNAEDNVTYGAEPIWAGPAHNTIIGDEKWDLVLLVKYPSRQHFIDKLNDPVYLASAQVRAAALEDSRAVELTQLLPAQ
ncbi:MAG: DUF1330 domain-containing protein [Actinomycetes bacterium]